MAPLIVQLCTSEVQRPVTINQSITFEMAVVFTAMLSAFYDLTAYYLCGCWHKEQVEHSMVAGFCCCCCKVSQNKPLHVSELISLCSTEGRLPI